MHTYFRHHHIYFRHHHVVLFIVGFCLLCFLMFVYPISPAHGDLSGDMVGLVKRVKTSAFGTPPNRDREEKFLRFPVVQRELIETGSSGGLVIEFLDKTTLTLGPNSVIELESYVYDPEAAQLTTVITVSVGLMRYVSGKVQNTDALINTPSALIGIRGSDAVITVDPDGATTLAVISGKFSFSNRDRSERRTVTASQSVKSTATGAVGKVIVKPVVVPKELNIPITSVKKTRENRVTRDKDPKFGLLDDDHHSGGHDYGDGHGDDHGHDGGGGGGGGGGGHGDGHGDHND